MKQILAVFSFILLTATFAAADGYVKTQSHTDPISVMGQNQPATDIVTEQWIGNGKVATVSPESTTILDIPNQMIYMINHQNRTYVASPLPPDFTKILPPEVAGIMQGMQMTLAVTPTGQKKTIGSRTCDEYDIDMTVAPMTVKLKMYATTEVPFDYKDYMENIFGALIQTQMIGIDDASIGELGKINGFVIAQEMTGDIMGASIRQYSEAVEITEKPAPAGIYSVPDGYTRKETLSLEELQNRQGP